MRQRQFSDITRQRGADGTIRDPVEVAREKTDWILKKHHPEPLEPAQIAELESILSVAEQEFG